MKTADPFLPQITANPGDQPLRLIYADWLEDRGDARGEFIRLQSAMASLAPHTDKYAQLKARAKELRPQLDQAWLKSMGYVPTHRPLFSRLPRRRVERWRLVEEFIEVWHRPLRKGDGFSESELTAAEDLLGLKLPAALREWYALAGSCKDFWSVQDRLLGPSKLDIDRENDLLVLRYENQGCEKWGIRLEDMTLDDPPVYQVYTPARTSTTTTAFAIFVLLYEVKFSRNVSWAGGVVTEDVVRREVTAKYKKCGFSGHYWMLRPVLYEGTDIIIETQQDGWVFVATRTEAAFEQLGEAIRERLERY